MDRYGRDVLAQPGRPDRAYPVIEAEPGLVVEDRDGRFCGAVVGFEAGSVVLEDRRGQHRLFPLAAGAFLLDGEAVTLARPRAAPPSRRTASGSRAAAPHPARVARASRIWVEGLHDAALLERVWGDDLRAEGVVVEPMSGVDRIDEAVRSFAPGPRRRLGILVDHLVAGSKETRLAASVTGPHVLIAGHPYVDVWQAIRPSALGIPAWPVVPPGRPWKEGVCVALGVADPAELWRRILSKVDSYRDLETPLIGAVERLIDHVTDPDPG